MNNKPYRVEWTAEIGGAIRETTWKESTMVAAVNAAQSYKRRYPESNAIVVEVSTNYVLYDTSRPGRVPRS